MTKTIYIEGMSCDKCKQKVYDALAYLPGVNSVEVSLEDKKAVVDLSMDILDYILMDMVTDAGYTPTRCEVG